MPRISIADFDIEKITASSRRILSDMCRKEIPKEFVEALSNKKAGDNMGNRKNPRCNSEGYADPTPYEALRNIDKANAALDDKVNFLFKVIRFIASEAGFDILNRIEVQDRQSGKVFK